MNDINIRYIKLVNGEELYTEVIESSADTIIISNPLSVKTRYDNQLGEYMSISEWIPVSPIKTYTLNKSHIIVSISVNNTIKQQYIEFFSTPDETPSGNNKPSETFMVLDESNNKH